MQIEVKGRNLQVTDEMREHAERRFEKIAKQVSELATLDLEVADENVPGRPDRGRGGAAPQGHAAAGQGGLQGRQARDQPRRGQLGAPGQAPSRQASRPARLALRGRGSRARARGRSRKRPSSLAVTPRIGARSTASLGSYVHPRARPPNGRSEAVQGLLQARRADQRLGARAPRVRRTTSSSEQFAELRERAREGESLEDLLPESFALTREVGRDDGHAALRRAADRRHGAARRVDRRGAAGCRCAISTCS